jgi:hypothetical protein
MTKDEFKNLKLTDKVEHIDKAIGDVWGEVVAITTYTWIKWYYPDGSTSDPQRYDEGDWLFFYGDWRLNNGT